MLLPARRLNDSMGEPSRRAGRRRDPFQEAALELILASTSPYRRALLARLGLPFRSLEPRFEETAGRPGDDPARLVVQNALGKALSVVAECPGSLIISSDQVAECEGEILTKPGAPQRAVEQLMRLAGREHRLFGGLAVVRAPGTPAPPSISNASPKDGGVDRSAMSNEDLSTRTALVVTHLRIRPLARSEAEEYVRRESPLDCAGAYKSEGLGIALFDYLRGDDPTAVIGLPLIALTRLLRAFGCDPLGKAPTP